MNGVDVGPALFGEPGFDLVVKFELGSLRHAGIAEPADDLAAIAKHHLMPVGIALGHSQNFAANFHNHFLRYEWLPNSNGAGAGGKLSTPKSAAALWPAKAAPVKLSVTSV